MAGHRTPGPLGSSVFQEPVDQGTSALAATPSPGPVNVTRSAVPGAAPFSGGSVLGAGAALPVLSFGSQGRAVAELQRLLNASRGVAPIKIDGRFGPKTLAAVRDYQRSRGLQIDGVVGPRTWWWLRLDERHRTEAASAPATPKAPRSAPTRRVPKAPEDAPKKERRFIDIRWVEEESYCGGPATLTGTTLNYADGSSEKAEVVLASDASAIDSVALKITGDAFTQNVPVKNWLPRLSGGNFEETRDQLAKAGGQQTAKPLKMQFIPTLALAECTIGIAHFHMLVKNYECQIQGKINYVPGFMAWLIQLGSTVDPAPPSWAKVLLPSRVLNQLWKQPGGQAGVDWGTSNPNSFSGSDWRFAKDDAKSPSGMSYHDGKAWKPVPDSWTDTNNVKLYGIGIWREGTENKAQFGNSWPEQIPKWSAGDQAIADKVLPTWESNCKSAWSNKFDLRRDGCPSTDDTCCRYPATATVSFTAEVKREGHTIVIGVNNGRSNAGAWSMGDKRPGLAPHEFGHHLGAPDEYPGGVGIDTTVNTDGATKGIDSTSLMGSVPASSVPPIKARHLKTVSQHLSDMIQAAKGVAWKFKTVAHK